MSAYIDTGALYSADRRYRYLLFRRLGRGDRHLVFILLNPSTATEYQDDPTIRRCVGFASRWGYDQLTILNIFALRATDPRQLYHSSDPVGVDNLSHIEKIKADLFIAGWGRHGQLNSQGEKVKQLLPKLKCLGTNQDGSPKHPLYLPNSASIIAFN